MSCKKWNLPNPYLPIIQSLWFKSYFWEDINDTALAIWWAVFLYQQSTWVVIKKKKPCCVLYIRPSHDKWWHSELRFMLPYITYEFPPYDSLCQIVELKRHNGLREFHESWMIKQPRYTRNLIYKGFLKLSSTRNPWFFCDIQYSKPYNNPCSFLPWWLLSKW